MKLIKLSLNLLILLFILSCGAPTNNVLVVGTNAEFPPFEYLEKDTIVGFDVDLIKAVAKELDKEVRIENLSWEGLLPALQSKKVDLIIAGMTVTEDRKKVVLFSDTYYIAEEQMIIVTRDNNTITDMESLVGKTVGVVLGFTGDTIVSGLEGVQVQRFNAAYQAVLALQQNRIDAIVLDNEPAKNYVKNTPDLKAIPGNNTQEEYSIALRKEDTKLHTQVNEALKILKENGTYDTIHQQYFQ